jgi:hypothetical protein
MTRQPWTPDALTFAWGDAYELSYERDRWVALRRDGQAGITACTLDLLEQAIRENYRRQAVPRDYDPPGATDYLAARDGEPWWGEADEERQGDDCRIYGRAEPERAEAGQEEPGEDANTSLDAETRLILAELRQLFPYWEVAYSAELGTWRAKSRYGSFSEPTIALVWVGLTRLERRTDWD